MTNYAAAYEAQRAQQIEVDAQATTLGIELHIKHAGRWCRLRHIENGKALYIAPRKEQRTRRANHKPVFIEIDLPGA